MREKSETACFGEKQFFFLFLNALDVVSHVRHVVNGVNQVRHVVDDVSQVRHVVEDATIAALTLFLGERFNEPRT